MIGPAPHSWENAEACLGVEGNRIIPATLPGDRLELWTYVGGGGGHALHIDRASVRLRYTTSEETNARYQQHEELKKKIAEHDQPHLENEQYSASSDWDTANQQHIACLARLGRINGPGGSGAWCSGACDTEQWLQIDFLYPQKIESLAIQGRGRCLPQESEQWVTSFKIGVSFDGHSFCLINNGEPYLGNDDTDTIRFIPLEDAVGRYIRIYPYEWVGHISLRCGFKARPLSSQEVTDGISHLRELAAKVAKKEEFEKERRERVLQLQSTIQDWQYSASSEWNSDGTHSPHFARIDAIQHGVASAWCSGVVDQNQWIQLDLQRVVNIRVFAIQGRGDAHQWVKTARLGVSDDGKNWTLVNDGEIFQCNVDSRSVVYHDINAKGRFFRLYPITSFAHHSLRFGLIWD